MDIEQARFNMIEQQIRTCGVLEPGTLEALAAVRRERFVPPALQAQVRSLEIEPALATQARINLDRAGVDNVLVEDADGAAGEPEYAPYDLILASGAVDHIPQIWLEQLKVGGRVFAFVGAGAVMKARMLTRVSAAEYRERDVFETVVPPLRLARARPFRL